MKDKILRNTLLGAHVEMREDPLKHRLSNWTFPGIGGEPDIKIKLQSNDGMILHLLQRIVALEEKVNKKK